jgi:hypothetical protein
MYSPYTPPSERSEDSRKSSFYVDASLGDRSVAIFWCNTRFSPVKEWRLSLVVGASLGDRSAAAFWCNARFSPIFLPSRLPTYRWSYFLLRDGNMGTPDRRERSCPWTILLLFWNKEANELVVWIMNIFRFRKFQDICANCCNCFSNLNDVQNSGK